MTNDKTFIAKPKRLLIIIFAALITVSCYQEFDYTPIKKNIPITVNNHAVILDTNARFALLSIANFDRLHGEVNYTGFQEIMINETLLENGNAYDFGAINYESDYRLVVTTPDSLNKDYSLQFTLLPIIHIEHKYESISQESKSIAAITVIDPDKGFETIEFCGIETRGASSFYYPKKSYSFALRQNAENKKGKPVALLGMGSYEKWILDAAYLDASLLRNRVSFDVWNEMQQSISGTDLTPITNNGRFVELFINNQYQGIYCLSERYDDQIINTLQTGDGQQPFLYKSIDWSPATHFTGTLDTIRTFGEWAGWEQRSPDTKELSIWKPLYDFIGLVAYADTDVFYDSIASLLNIDQAIDYYIFINLILGYDNAGKNIFLAKRQGFEPFYIYPWDLDATWGRDWQGEAMIGRDDVYMRLFGRLTDLNPDQFNQRLYDRWFGLRQSVLEYNHLMAYFYRYHDLLLSSGAYQRENERWPSSIAYETEIEFIREWSIERLNRLDQFFSSLVK